MFVICRNISLPTPWDNPILSSYKNALTRWGNKWWYATSLAKPTVFENAVEAQIVVEGEVKKQYPEDEIVVRSVDIFQTNIPIKLQVKLDGNASIKHPNDEPF